MQTITSADTALDFELVQSLLEPISELKEAKRPRPNRRYTVIYRGIPAPVASLEEALEWFNTYGQPEILVDKNCWATDDRQEFSTLHAKDLKPGMLVRTRWSSEPPMRIRNLLGETDWHISFSFSYQGAIAIDSTTYHKLWQFQLMEEHEQ